MRGNRISIVAPVYEEEENVVALVEGLLAVMSTQPYEVEVVLVNDGSGPRTTAILDGLAASHPAVGVVHLSRNFGHQAALTAGVDHCQGDAVIVMDADLQHPPQVIPELLARWEAGCDVVYTIRDDVDAQAGGFKRLTSRVFYALMNRMSDTSLPAGAADFRLMDRAAADAMRSMRERTRFLRGLSSWIGFEQAGVHYRAAARRAGKSKFVLPKMLRLAFDAMISMSTLPLRVALMVGFVLSTLSFVYLVYVVWAHYFTNRTLFGWSSLIVAVLFLGGLQINSIGVVGLYVAKIYEEVKQRPLYIVRRKAGKLDRA